MSWPISRSVCQSDSQLFCSHSPVYQLVGRSFGQSVSWSLAQSFGHLVLALLQVNNRSNDVRIVRRKYRKVKKKKGSKKEKKRDKKSCKRVQLTANGKHLLGNGIVQYPN